MRDSRHAASARELLLTFRMARGRYALRLSEVAGLAEVGPLRPVPGAPAGVMGLGGWRGRLLTVLDLPRLLGEETPDHPFTCLVRLAPPLEGTALLVPAAVHVVRPQEPEAEPTVRDPGPEKTEGPPDGDEPFQLLEPAALVQALESRIAGPARPGPTAPSRP